MSAKYSLESEKIQTDNAVKFVYRKNDESDARLLKRYIHHIINLHPLYINMANDMTTLRRKDIELILITYDNVVQNLIANLDWKP